MADEKVFKAGQKIKVDATSKPLIEVNPKGIQGQVRRDKKDCLLSEVYTAEWDWVDDFNAQDILLMLVFVQPGEAPVVMSYERFIDLFGDEPDTDGIYRLLPHRSKGETVK